MPETRKDAGAEALLAAREEAYKCFSPVSPDGDEQQPKVPPFQLSDVVKKVLTIQNEGPIREQLSRLSNQHSPNDVVRRELRREYDVVHFPSTGVKLQRLVFHYNIAMALHKVSKAEDALIKAGYAIIYAVSDAHIVLLLENVVLDELKEETASFDVHHFTQDVVTNEDGTKDFSPIYVRTITDEAVVLAYEGLVSSPAIFSVRNQEDRPFMAFAFFTESAEDGEVKVSIDIQYQEVPYFQRPAAGGLVRA